MTASALVLALFVEGATDERFLPIIVRRTAETLLADPDALQAVVGTRIDAQQLGLPLTARDIESDRYPKITLERAMSSAFADRSRRQRRRRVHVSEIIEPLAQRIKLDRLDALSAYRQFKDDLFQALVNERLAE